MVHGTCSTGWFGAVLDPLQFASFVRWKHTQPIPHGPECGRSSVQCIDPVAFFSVDKHRFGCYRFEREIYSPAGGARPMDSSRWYYNALPWSEGQTAGG